MDVSTTDLAYRDLEKLQSFDLVDPPIVGQRPYTRLDFARFARQARSRLDARHTEYVRGIVERLERRFASELEASTTYRGIEQAAMHVTGARSPSRSIREHLGAVDAVINPLLGYRQGRRLVDGVTGGLETVHWFRLSDGVAVYARPRFQLSEARGSAENINDVTVQEAYGRVAFGMFSLQAGRSNMVWGQGRHAGMILSGNARGFDMVKLTNEPWVPPWIFRYFGPTKGTVFLATTVADRDRHFVNSYVFGYKVSFQPATWLELAATFMVEAGGEGAPEASFGDRLTDHLFFVDLFVTDADVFFSNKIGGGEFRIRVPGARGLQL
ncbi:MAG: capsule assembly Wzi family protein, partial [Planctomycetota bacterium]